VLGDRERLDDVRRQTSASRRLERRALRRAEIVVDDDPRGLVLDNEIETFPAVLTLEHQVRVGNPTTPDESGSI
jgi:hypothetical protein